MSIFRTSGRSGSPWQIDMPWPRLLMTLSVTIAVVLTANLALFRFGKTLPGLIKEAVIQVAVLTEVLLMFALLAPPPGKLAGKIGLRRLRVKDIGAALLGLILIYAWQILSLPLWEKFLRRFGRSFETRQELLNECSHSTPQQFAFMLALAGVLIPFVEEICFRRLIFGLFRPLGVCPALIATALLFAAAHGFVYGFPVLFGLGVVFELQYILTGNLLTSTLTHMIYNLISLTLTFLLGRM